ncbi:MAG: arsenosugar biosynthesis radical SAM protein ArsS [Candidatus Polarisedimenticolaceae bacterium]|nr:arsenosugar biosynthesis radical SAM protein ArsS [Candidatus Polarisedimenticolaceae bacterium]
MLETVHLLTPSDFPSISREKLTTLQVNLGLRCNQVCIHCHVNAGPKRDEMMSLEMIDLVLSCLDREDISTLDLTGGAPELNPNFRYLVEAAVAKGVHVMDRCNLTILSEPGQEDLAQFLADNRVEVVASLPCYLEENVDAQRGNGVFARSITGLQQLNALGYGMPESGLSLNLVYNPAGASLPPSQQVLESAYKTELAERFAIQFNHLFTITNMPIQRFGSMLLSKNEFSDYMTLLKGAYKGENLSSVMCRSLLNVDWQGYLFDCDFNQMLDMPITDAAERPLHLRELQGLDLLSTGIKVGGHCYGCTAGQGSSCGGAL